MVANRGLPEVEVLRRADGNAEIALTLLRCVGWLSRDDLPERKGHAGPGLPTPGAQMPGKWVFEYAIIPHASAGRLAAIQQAYAFEAPLRAVDSGLHEGVYPGSGSFLQVEPGEFSISAVKTAENQRGWVVRGINLSAEPLTARLRLLSPFHAAEQVNLAEESPALAEESSAVAEESPDQAEESPAQAEESLARPDPGDARSIALEVKGHEVVTVRFQA
jgi:alpha-mannosidase